VARRAVGMAVDQGRTPCRRNASRTASAFTSMISAGLAAMNFPASFAQAPDGFMARRKRLGEELTLPVLGARHAAPGLVVVIVGAQRIAVHQGHRLAGEPDHARIVQEAGSAGGEKSIADKEIPVTVHEPDLHALF